MQFKKGLVIKEEYLTTKAQEGLKLMRMSGINLTEYFNAQFENYYKIYQVAKKDEQNI